jgi:peptidyl-prolyl cis-trans isomerase SurA
LEESFESQARIYSEDEGSAANGGLIKNIYKGQMVKPLKQQH